jgi:low affinity Fe/Cu permease
MEAGGDDPSSPKRPEFFGTIFERIAERITRWVTTAWGLATAAFVFFCWLIVGPYLGWAEAWYYVDAFVAFATFIFIFSLQRMQKKDSIAIQTKLNELLAAVDRASPRLINLENMSEEQVAALHEKYAELQEQDPGPHSIDECDADGSTADSKAT